MDPKDVAKLKKSGRYRYQGDDPTLKGQAYFVKAGEIVPKSFLDDYQIETEAESPAELDRIDRGEVLLGEKREAERRVAEPTENRAAAKPENR